MTFGGTLPGRKPGSRAALPYCAVTLGDFGVDHVGRDFDDEVLAGLADVDEFSLHSCVLDL